MNETIGTGRTGNGQFQAGLAGHESGGHGTRGHVLTHCLRNAATKQGPSEQQSESAPQRKGASRNNEKL